MESIKRWRYSGWPVICLFILIGLAIYGNSLGNPFLYDDKVRIVENPNIRTLNNVPHFFAKTGLPAKNPFEEFHFRPLVVTSYALNYALGGLNPVGYHLVNLAFHVGTAFLIFLIVGTMLESQRDKNVPLIDRPDKNVLPIDRRGFLTPSVVAALAAGLIFLVHPFNSEAVNYITARSSLMSGFFYLLGFYCWVRYRQLAVSSKQLADGGKESAGRTSLSAHYYYCASILAFVAGMLSKEVGVTLPAVLWLYDLYFGGRRLPAALLNWRTYLPYLPFILVVAVPYVLIRTFMFSGVLPHFIRDLQTQVFTILPVLVKYWQMFLIPVPLTPAHSVVIHKTFWSFPVIYPTLILAISAAIAILLSLISSRPWKVVSFFMLWFLIVLMPVTIFPLNAIFQENRGYVAIISFAVLAGVILGESCKAGIRKAAMSVLVLMTLVYGADVVQRNRVWGDEVTFWSDAAQKAPDIPITHVSLGNAYRRAGMYDQAVDAYKRARAVGGPKYPEARYRLAEVYILQERWDLAAPALEEAKEILLNDPGRRSDLEIVYNNLETAYHKTGKPELAEKLSKEARERLGRVQ